MRSKPTGQPDGKDRVAKVQHVNDIPDAGKANVNIPIYIGDKLKALYAEVVNQPVPDHLLDLVSKLESQSKGG